MAMNSKIEWTDHSWPIVNGCRRISPGCGGARGVGGCYAERLAATRLSKTPKYGNLAIFGQHGPQWTGETRLWVKDLEMPLRLKKPSKIFVADMGDLFFEGVSNEEIAAVFGVMTAAHWHIFQVLTKRTKRLLEWFAWYHPPKLAQWPLPNVWIGASVENQKYADERVPDLLQTPAAVRFLSCEPLLGPIDISRIAWPGALARATGLNGALPDPSEADDWKYWVRKDGGIAWVIAGGESGPGARPMHPAWARSLRDQCVAAGVPYFFKQWGQWQLGSTKTGRHNEIVLSDGRHGTTPQALGFDKASDASAWNALDPTIMASVGKKKAGRLLDGREWSEFPEARS